MIYSHYSKYPTSKWRWPSFKPKEIACKGDNNLMIDTDAMDKLQKLRDLLGRPMYINSAYRSPSYNKKVGGAKASQHLKAKAFDINMKNHSTIEFERLAREAGFTGFGFYPQYNFIHIDTGRARHWGKRWRKDNRKGPSATPVSDSVTPVAAEHWLVVLIRRIFGQ